MIAGTMSQVIGFNSQRLSMVSPVGSTLVAPAFVVASAPLPRPRAYASVSFRFVVCVDGAVVAAPIVTSAVLVAYVVLSLSLVAPVFVVASASLPRPLACASVTFSFVVCGDGVVVSASVVSSAVLVACVVLSSSLVAPAFVVASAPRPRPLRRFPLCRPAPSPVFLYIVRCVSCRVWGATLAHRTRHRQDTQLRPATPQPHCAVLHDDCCPHLQQAVPARPVGLSGAGC